MGSCKSKDTDVVYSDVITVANVVSDVKTEFVTGTVVNNPSDVVTKPITEPITEPEPEPKQKAKTILVLNDSDKQYIIDNLNTRTIEENNDDFLIRFSPIYGEFMSFDWNNRSDQNKKDPDIVSLLSRYPHFFLAYERSCRILLYHQNNTNLLLLTSLGRKTLLNSDSIANDKLLLSDEKSCEWAATFNDDSKMLLKKGKSIWLCKYPTQNNLKMVIDIDMEYSLDFEQKIYILLNDETNKLMNKKINSSEFSKNCNHNTNIFSGCHEKLAQLMINIIDGRRIVINTSTGNETNIVGVFSNISIISTKDIPEIYAKQSRQINNCNHFDAFFNEQNNKIYYSNFVIDAIFKYMNIFDKSKNSCISRKSCDVNTNFLSIVVNNKKLHRYFDKYNKTYLSKFYTNSNRFDHQPDHQPIYLDQKRHTGYVDV